MCNGRYELKDIGIIRDSVIRVSILPTVEGDTMGRAGMSLSDLIKGCKPQENAVASMSCSIGYGGQQRQLRIGITKENVKYFPTRPEIITIEIDGEDKYSELNESFFNKCPELSTAYDFWDDARSRTGPNRLVEWLHRNKIGMGDRVCIDVLVPRQSFGLRGYSEKKRYEKKKVRKSREEKAKELQIISKKLQSR